MVPRGMAIAFICHLKDYSDQRKGKDKDRRSVFAHIYVFVKLTLSKVIISPEI